MTSDLPFWQRKALDEMTTEEWESLCDGCGKCCLIKLEDEDSGDIVATDVTCKLLDLSTCRCSQYAQRSKYVPDCVTLTPENIGSLGFMPATCGYRLLAEGKPLEDWHPLVSGDANSVHTSGNSVLDRVVHETEVEDADLEDHVIDWFDGESGQWVVIDIFPEGDGADTPSQNPEQDKAGDGA